MRAFEDINKLIHRGQLSMAATELKTNYRHERWALLLLAAIHCQVRDSDYGTIVALLNEARSRKGQVVCLSVLFYTSFCLNRSGFHKDVVELLTEARTLKVQYQQQHHHLIVTATLIHSLVMLKKWDDLSQLLQNSRGKINAKENYQQQAIQMLSSLWNIPEVQAQVHAVNFLRSLQYTTKGTSMDTAIEEIVDKLKMQIELWLRHK